MGTGGKAYIADRLAEGFLCVALLGRCFGKDLSSCVRPCG